MENSIKIIIVGLLLILGFNVFSQTAAESRTYQFIFFSEDAKNLFFQSQEKTTLADSVFIKLEQLRQPNEVVYAKISSRTIIKIIPSNVINSGFYQLEKYFIELDKNKQENIFEQAIDIED